jgi:hypothetical protein
MKYHPIANLFPLLDDDAKPSLLDVLNDDSYDDEKPPEPLQLHAENSYNRHHMLEDGLTF